MHAFAPGKLCGFVSVDDRVPFADELAAIGLADSPGWLWGIVYDVAPWHSGRRMGKDSSSVTYPCTVHPHSALLTRVHRDGTAHTAGADVARDPRVCIQLARA